MMMFISGNFCLSRGGGAMSRRLIIASCCALLAGAANAAPGDKSGIVRDLASRVGPIVGAGAACRSIARPRIQAILEKFTAVAREVTTSEVEYNDINQLLDRTMAEGSRAVTAGQIDCGAADRQLAELERSINIPAAAPAPAPPAYIAPPVMAQGGALNVAAAAGGGAIRGVTDREIRFGMAAPFSGAAKELGRQTKIGIDTAFNRVNEFGGVEGRMLKLIAVDDGYEATRTGDAMKQLYDKEQVLGFIGNVGTSTAAVSLPFALERRALFFGGFTGAMLLRRDPPDRYVFNYRVSYAEETDAVVRYLVKVRRLQPKQIAVFAQQDPFGDAGFAGVVKAMRGLGIADSAILRLGYKRNTVEVDEAVNMLRAQKVPIRAIVMVATYRAAAKFIEKSHEAVPGMIYTNVSAVGATSLAEELLLLGARYANGVIVTQAVPAVSGYSSLILEYKAALAKSFPGEAPDYVSLEGYISANILIQALKRAGPQPDTEKIVDALENTRNLDLGLGTIINFGRAEHQGSHKVWGTVLDETGKFQPIDLD
jgi:ABC-type branched-subunit amino acid transport system substrate-binding protein